MTLFTGVYREFHSNGQLKLECFKLNGKLNGIQKIYYSNGQLQMEIEFINGILQCIHNSYTREGKWWLNTIYYDYN